MTEDGPDTGLPDPLAGDLRSVLGDRSRGASEIEGRLRDRLARCWEGGQGPSTEEPSTEGPSAEDLLVFLTRAVRELQPAMANLLRLVNRSWLAWEEGGTERARRRALVEWWREGAAGGGERGGRDGLADHLQQLAREIWLAPETRPAAVTVLTLSRSGTVLAGLRALGELFRDRGRPLRVVVGEGRPGNEGFGLAEDLLERDGEHGLEVTVVTDALLLALAAGGVSPDGLEVEPGRAVALLGADAVGPEAFVNKVGSGALARVARDRGVPVWLLAGEAKVVPAELFELLELPEAPAAELGAPEGVPVRNLYFERVPLGLLERRVGEEGAEGPDALSRRAGSEPVSQRMLGVWKS